MKLGKMNDKIDDLDDEIDRKDSLKKASIKFLGDLEIIQQIKNTFIDRDPSTIDLQSIKEINDADYEYDNNSF